LFPPGPQAVEADEAWKAGEYAAFPPPLENAPRFPRLPQPQLLQLE
jgi:hypothetical protein